MQIKCDERRPHCNNCEKAGRDCEYDPSPQSSTTTPRPSPIQAPAPSPAAPASSASMYFAPSFGIYGHATETPGQSIASAPPLPFPYSHDVYSTAHSVDLLPPRGFMQTQPTGTAPPISASISSSPQHKYPSNAATLVRNAGFTNDVQSQSSVQTAIRALSRDYRLPGQYFTIETVLSPMIFRSTTLRHAVLAAFLLQSDPSPLTSPSRVSESFQDHPPNLSLQHYQIAMTHLNETIDNPELAEVNLATHLILGFYCIVKEDLAHWTFHNRNATDQLRARGQTVLSHPPSLPAKFLFQLHIRTDTVGSNAVGLSATTDPETIQIAYSGSPISNASFLPARMELELLLADISVFQYDCSTVLPIVGSGWQTPQMEAMRIRYHHLLEKLGKWPGLTIDGIGFEDAEVGEYIQGSLLPSEMGSPLLCVSIGLQPSHLTCSTINRLRSCGCCIVLQQSIYSALQHGITLYLEFPMT